MDKEVRNQIQEYKETIKFYQDVLDVGKEFQNGFDSKGNPETNLDIAHRKVKDTKQLLNEYIITTFGYSDNINYFVWGDVNGKSESFYLEPAELEKFMQEQNFTDVLTNAVRDLTHCRGISFRDKGFTIERKIKTN